jgi:hypothetical protein
MVSEGCSPRAKRRAKRRAKEERQRGTPILALKGKEGKEGRAKRDTHTCA